MRTEKHWIGTASGRKFYPLDPRPEDICIEDIAHHLAGEPRFTSATLGEYKYSVAQHCVIGSLFCEKPLDFLLHDASEAYLKDLPRPIKHHPAMWFYREAEERLQRMICGVYGLDWPLPDCVKRVDDIMCETERRDLLTPTPEWHILDATPLPITIKPWPPDIARKQFLGRFEALTSPFAWLRSIGLAPRPSFALN